MPDVQLRPSLVAICSPKLPLLVFVLLAAGRSSRRGDRTRRGGQDIRGTDELDQGGDGTGDALVSAAHVVTEGQR